MCVTSQTTEGIEMIQFSETAEKRFEKDYSLCQGTSVEQWLKRKYSIGNFGINELTEKGYYKLLGWRFNLRPWLNLYIVRDLQGYIYLRWAPSVSHLREALGLSRYTKVAACPDNLKNTQEKEKI